MSFGRPRAGRAGEAVKGVSVVESVRMASPAEAAAGTRPGAVAGRSVGRLASVTGSPDAQRFLRRLPRWAGWAGFVHGQRRGAREEANAPFLGPGREVAAKKRSR